MVKIYFSTENYPLKYELDYLDEYLTLFRIRNNNAGFKPSVQLYSKANTWFYMKNDSNTKLILQ